MSHETQIGSDQLDADPLTPTTVQQEADEDTEPDTDIDPDEDPEADEGDAEQPGVEGQGFTAEDQPDQEAEHSG
jgi:hypothetical protein